MKNELKEILKEALFGLAVGLISVTVLLAASVGRELFLLIAGMK